MNNTETLKSYEIAENELKEMWETLGIESNVVKIGGAVKENNWACVEFRVTFKKGTNELNVPYYLGTGFMDKIIGYKYKLTKEEQRIYELMQKRTIIREDCKKEFAKKSADIAARYTPASKAKPWEVFSRLIADMPDECFDDWCSNFGYDSDSIKAKETYDTCVKYGFEAKKFVSREVQEKLINLVNEL